LDLILFKKIKQIKNEKNCDQWLILHDVNCLQEEKDKCGVENSLIKDVKTNDGRSLSIC
jgi:hypothetical protein